MTAENLDKARRYRWLIFILLSFGYILVYFHRLCPAVLAVDIMRDFNVGGALTGLLGSAYFYPYALMQLPAGLLSDSWGPRKTITIFFIVAFLGSIVLWLAPSVFWAIVGRTIVGIGVAMLFVPTMKILAEWFHKQEFAYMTGILLAVGGIGSLTAATPLVWVSAWIGWRKSFLMVGGFTLLLAVLVGIFVRNRPSDMGWPSPAGDSDKDGEEKIGLAQGLKIILSNRYFWPLAIWCFFNYGVFFSFGGLWGGPYLMHVYGYSKAEAGAILNMLAVGLVAGAPFVGWLSDKVFKHRKPVLLLCSAIVPVLTGLLAFHTDGIPKWGLYALIFALTVFGNAIGVIVFTMNKELFPIGIAGTATGLVNLFCFAGGALYQPFLGYILEHHHKLGETFSIAGYQAAFLALFLTSLVAFASTLFSRETMRVQ
jgi:sugar phosphate permease